MILPLVAILRRWVQTGCEGACSLARSALYLLVKASGRRVLTYTGSRHNNRPPGQPATASLPTLTISSQFRKCEAASGRTGLNFPSPVCPSALFCPVNPLLRFQKPARQCGSFQAALQCGGVPESPPSEYQDPCRCH